jgi:hypothetical protein
MHSCKRARRLLVLKYLLLLVLKYLLARASLTSTKVLAFTSTKVLACTRPPRCTAASAAAGCTRARRHFAADARECTDESQQVTLLTFLRLIFFIGIFFYGILRRMLESAPTKASR